MVYIFLLKGPQDSKSSFGMEWVFRYEVLQYIFGQPGGLFTSSPRTFRASWPVGFPFLSLLKKAKFAHA